jgi:hypothetical protein
MGTTTHIAFFKRMLGATQTIEPVGPALTLHRAVPSDTVRLDDHHVSPTRSSMPASSWRC